MSIEHETPEGFIQLVVPLERDPGEDGPEAEWVWAEPLGSGRYRIESSPFFAYGLSCGDIVRAQEVGPGEPPEVMEVEHKGGGRTLRIALAPQWDIDAAEVEQFLDQFLEIGCSYEALPPKLVALAVPPEVDVATVVERLQVPFRDGLLLWEWADPRPC